MARTTLATFNTTAIGNPQTVTFNQPSTPGQTIVMITMAAAVVTPPAGWNKTQIEITSVELAVHVLPASSHVSPLSSIDLDISATYGIAAYVFEDSIDGEALSYIPTVNTTYNSTINGGLTTGTGGHTVTADEALSIHALSTVTGGNNAIGADPQSYDQGFVEECDVATPDLQTEDVRLSVAGSTSPVNFSNEGVSVTYDISVDTVSRFGSLIAYNVVVGADTDPPVLVSRAPAVDATSVPVVSTIRATFDEALGGTPSIALSPVVAGSLSNNAGVLTFTPDADLAYNTTYTVTVSGIEDTLGNAASNISWSFTTAAEGEIAFGATIAEEIALPGAPVEDVTISGYGDPDTLGFVRATSYNAGETAQFSLSSASVVDIDIYRVGGYDTGWRFIERITNTPAAQPAAATIAGGAAGTGVATECSAWSVTASWTVPANAWSGMYVAVPRAVPGPNASWIPFTVRNDSRDADIVVKASDTTWGAAYNAFGTQGDATAVGGGASTYGSGGTTFDINNRAYAVSLDRPIIVKGTVALTYWLNGEAPLWRFLDKQGYNWKLISSLDLDEGLTAVGNAKVLVSAGHDEYWSQGMRDNAEAFRDAGGHLIFMSGNEVFWRVRFSPDRRTMYCYKDTMNNGNQIDPVEWTGTWRDTRWGSREPENLLTGTFFRMNNAGVDYALTVDAATYGSSPFWRGTTVATGTNLTLNGVIGFEADEPVTPPAAASSVLVADATIAITGALADDNGQTYGGSGDFNWGLHLMLVGSSVVAGFGTVQWAWALDPVHDNGRNTADYENTQAKQATINLLTDMGATASTPQAGLVAPTAVSFREYGLTADAQDFFVSDGTVWRRVGSVPAHEAAAHPHPQYLLGEAMTQTNFDAITPDPNYVYIITGP